MKTALIIFFSIYLFFKYSKIMFNLGGIVFYQRNNHEKFKKDWENHIAKEIIDQFIITIAVILILICLIFI